MNDDPMKARAQRQIKAWKFKGDCLTREYAVVTAEMLSDFATKERSDARREGMEAAAKIASMFHRGFGGSPTWGAKTAGDIEQAIRAQIAEEAEHG